MRKGWRIQVKQSPFQALKVKFGFSFMTYCAVVTILAVFYFIGNYFGLAIGAASSYALVAGIRIKKDGLQGDTLKFVEDLEKRFELLADNEDKAAIANQIREALKPYEGVSIDKLKELLGEDDKGIRSILIKQGAAITALQEKQGSVDSVKSIRAQILDWQTRNRAILDDIKAGNKRDLPAIEIRSANSPMTVANTSTTTIAVGLPVPQFEAGIHDLRRIQPTFWDYIPKGRTGQAAYSWVNKKNPQGAAAFIGPSIAKPGVSFELQREVSVAKKIAVSSKMTIELLDDIDGMESFIKDEMTYQLRAKANTTMMTGTLSATVPAGIQTISVPYSLSGVLTDNANNFDAIRAIVAQLSVGFFSGLPVTVFINPVDSANMDLSKAVSQGTYILPPFSDNSGKRVAGAVVVEDNNVPVGFIQAACLDLFKTLIYKDFLIALGYENDDFTKNLVTYIAEMRIHSFHSDNDAGAFIYDSFSNIKAAIEIP